MKSNVVFVVLVCCSTVIGEEVDFQRDVRPILADACFHCHGPDENSREADLRLDQQPDSEILGDADESELLRRITSEDPDEVMPPQTSGKSLTDSQVGVLRKWIKSGARWDQHWSFEAPKKHSPSAKLQNNSWIRQPFDAFVLQRLANEGLSPSRVANRQTLIRRLSLDLTGLPPSWPEVQAFVADQKPDAYERLVDRLLESEHFGERMAMDWLDAARYADTDGYQADSTRTNWPWRDWVVRAFNSNKRFDEFTIEQFAGDLLPDASPDQIIATCFHRNHMTNGEGGRDPEESRIDYVIDRVNTMGTVWLGLTLGCTQCHSHKYDPISHAEYYQLNAFFNSIEEDGRAGGGAKPFYKYNSKQQQAVVQSGFDDSEGWLHAKRGEVAAIEAISLQEFGMWVAELKARLTPEFKSWHRPQASEIFATHGAQLSQNLQGEILVTGPNARHEDYRIAVTPELPRITGMRLLVLPIADGKTISLADDGHFILTNLKVNVAKQNSSQLRELSIATAVADYQKEKTGRSYGPVKTVLDDDPRSGWTSMGADAKDKRVAIFGFDKPVQLAKDEFISLEFRHRSLAGHMNMRRFAVEFTDEAGPTLTALGRTPSERLAETTLEALDDAAKKDLREQFLVDRSDVQHAREELRKARDRHAAYRKARTPVQVMVLQDKDELRPTHVLERGVWDKKGTEVTRGVPGVLHDLPIGEQPESQPSRLDLAHWLVDPNNPLTARVTVNRFWQMLFGYGLVRTPSDFGTQGEPPTHPRVLDWLAVEFQESGWNVKHVIKQIVMSATYQQSSTLNADLSARDPENRLLARNPRWRLPSWMIRDAALKVSGLMDARFGGPPVYPHQPPGAWADATMGRFHYEPSVGGDLYRRTLYAFWRRSVAPTGLFDASKRRNCEVRQIRTNTPLHALNLLNDETYVEAARVLAELALEAKQSDVDRIQWIFNRILGRDATDREIALLAEQIRTVRQEFQADADAAKSLLTIGQTQTPMQNDAAELATELATFSTLASTVLNLDEAITRE